ncbi:MAG: response regulator [Halanaerobiaceae bacterium]
MESDNQVLIIDDGRNIRLTLKRALNNAGYRVQTAPSGEIGLQKLREEQFSLVLLDLKLPGMNGLEVLAEMGGLEYSTEVIAMTAYDNNEDEKKARHLGAVEFIYKPFDCREILSLTKKHME